MTIGRLTTARRRVKRAGIIMVVLGLLIPSVGTALLETQAAACGLNSGYFWCGKVTPSKYFVMNGGIPHFMGNQQQIKSQFISFIESSYRNNPDRNAANVVGSAYIIQTMRGLTPNNGGGSHSHPNDAEIADWKKRINNPAVTVGWGNYIARINSARMNYTSPHRDVASYYGDSKFYFSLIFYYNGKPVTAIKQICANPLGALPGLPSFNEWSVSTSSSVDNTTVAPGQTITWTHSITNEGPNNTDKNVNWHYQNRLPDGSTWNDGSAKGTEGADHIFSSGQEKDSKQSFTSSFTVTQSHVGQTLCRATSASPAAWNNSGWTESSAACVSIPSSYSLTPVVSIPSSEIVEVGSTVTVDPVVNNSGPTKSKSTDWELTQMVVSAAGGIIPNSNGGRSSAAPCGTYFRNATTTCERITSGKTTFAANGSYLSGDHLNRQIREVEDMPAGTRLCFALSVKPASSSSNDWQHSKPVCVTVGKKPKVQVLGGDLLAGRQIPGALGSAPSAVIQTAVTVRNEKEVKEPAPQSAFTGLWKTGVDNRGEKLSANQPDPHWIIDRVIRPYGSSPTCQQAVVDYGDGLVPIPKTSASPSIPARTIVESGGLAGRYTSVNTNVTGSPVHPSVVVANGKGVWARMSDNARWIGQNQYGQNYSSSSCTDPTYGKTKDTDNANIYVFKLKDGFTISSDANIDLDSLKIKIKGGVDNLIRFYVNDKPLGDWQNPGWTAGSTATSTNVKNVFKTGKNSLEIWVQSTYTHSGVLIDEISINGDVRKTISDVSGSWVEYAATANGRITGIGSGAAYSKPRSTATVCGTSLLTFANTLNTAPCSSGTTPGLFSTNRSMPDVASAFVTSSSTPALSGSINLSSLDGLYRAKGNITITGGTIRKGQSVIINAPGRTVTISSNITYDNSPIKSIEDIPQVVIIADNIRIRGVNANTAVSQVDAWLIAKNTLNTCYDASSDSTLTINRCNTRLTVNGPVMAKTLQLWRTAGAGTGNAAGEPAEVFNFRPDAYLWGISQASNSGRLQTVYERELPPRF